MAAVCRATVKALKIEQETGVAVCPCCFKTAAQRQQLKGKA